MILLPKIDQKKEHKIYTMKMIDFNKLKTEDKNILSIIMKFMTNNGL